MSQDLHFDDDDAIFEDVDKVADQNVGARSHDGLARSSPGPPGPPGSGSSGGGGTQAGEARMTEQRLGDGMVVTDSDPPDNLNLQLNLQTSKPQPGIHKSDTMQPEKETRKPLVQKTNKVNPLNKSASHMMQTKHLLEEEADEEEELDEDQGLGNDEELDEVQDIDPGADDIKKMKAYIDKYGVSFEVPGAYIQCGKFYPFCPDYFVQVIKYTSPNYKERAKMH